MSPKEREARVVLLESTNRAIHPMCNICNTKSRVITDWGLKALRIDDIMKGLVK